MDFCEFGAIMVYTVRQSFKNTSEQTKPKQAIYVKVEIDFLCSSEEWSGGTVSACQG